MIFLRNIPLKKHSNYKIGGPADYFYEFKSKEELIEALREWKEIEPDNSNILILGKGTNILFSDAGFRGLVLKDDLLLLLRSVNIVTVGSGTLLSELVNFCSQNSLSGLEWAGGLPGTVGGAVRGNAGAFGGETKDNCLEVESLGIETLKTKTRNNKECKFGYRQSVFKSVDRHRPGGALPRREIILSAKFRLTKGNREEIKKKTQEKIDYRIDRHPLDLPNIGSTFKNIPIQQVPKKVRREFKDSIKDDPFPILPSAKLLATAGLKGKIVGGAKISEKHPNFIVNFNNARASDVLALIEIAKKQIKDKYDIALEEEIMYVG